jgi:MFS family permease
VFVITLSLLIVSFAGFIMVKDLKWFYALVIIFGLGYGSGLTQESPLVANLFGLKSHGLIFGFASTGHVLGAAVGTLMGGYLFDISGSYQLTFVICGMLTVVGLALVFALKPVKEPVRMKSQINN